MPETPVVPGPGDAPRRPGRPPTTSRRAIELTALQLFAVRGFDDTTVDEIAAACGIARRTLFRYFPSKNDLVWGDFDHERARLREALAARPAEEPTMRAVRAAVVATNAFGPDELPELRVRMRLLTTVPTLQAYSTLRYAEWRGDVARFAAQRHGLSDDALLPTALGHATLGVTLAAFLRWVALDGAQRLEPILDQALRALEDGFPDPLGDVSHPRGVAAR